MGPDLAADVAERRPLAEGGLTDLPGTVASYQALIGMLEGKPAGRVGAISRGSRPGSRQK